LILVGGGARSGKSRFGMELALRLSANPTFIATAQASDDEMADRIKRHQMDRDPAFNLIEEPIDLVAAINKSDDVILVDCLTLWLSNNLETKTYDFQAVITAAKNRKEETFFVTNEVGEGIVPMHPVSREFRDLSGRMNQEFAAASDAVYFLQFGIANKIK
jgi:adenosylcobinamide kinase/adenosylcobinamide-phosphate guanylyltransferase